jgi:hypothetical protein
MTSEFEGGSVSPAAKDPARRRLGAALVALTGASLATRVASAFPSRGGRLLHEVNELLRRFGLHLSVANGAHEVVTVRARGEGDTEYDFLAGEVPPDVGDMPPPVGDRVADASMKASFFHNVSEFTHFATGGGMLAPSVHTLADGPFIRFERFALDESRTAPKVTTTIEDTVTTFEHFDPAMSAIQPCFKVGVVEDPVAGDSATFEHFHPAESSVIPCIKVAVVERAATVAGLDVAETVTTFEHFDPAMGTLNPCFKVGVVESPGAPDLVTFEHFDPARFGINPCLKTTVVDTVTTIEHFDPAKSTIQPCFKVGIVEGEMAGVPDATTVTINDPAIDFAVVVGMRTWRLRAGVLVETP